MNRERILALTSLPPTTGDTAVYRDCIDSWRRAGMEVYSFNHPSELATLGSLFDVNFVPVAETASAIFGRHFVPIKTMLDWANAQSSPVMIINADIRLSMEPWQLKRVRWITDGGLCYFVRHNYDVDPQRSVREPWGIDAFMLHGLDSKLVPDTFLSMGRPSWDFLLPHAFLTSERPVYSVEHPVAFHKNHPRVWSADDVRRCSLELDRVTGLLGKDCSEQACIAMSVRLRQSIGRKRQVVNPMPVEAQDWVQRKFSNTGTKTFLELGARGGEDIAWMARLPGVTNHVFEPGPRMQPTVCSKVTLHRAAISDHDGQGLITLDTFFAAENLGRIDFIRASVRGAEGEMIRGGRRALEFTRYLMTTYSDDETCEGQVTLRQVMDMLPEFRVLELWPDEVLLENRKLAARITGSGHR